MKITLCTAFVAVAVMGAGLATADPTVPHQKVGLWESNMMMMGHPVTTQSCVSEASQAKMSVFSSQMRQKNCSSSSITHNIDGSWSSTSTCTFGGKARTSHAHITGSFDSKITMVLTTEGSGKPDMTMTMAWMGPCKPGMKGGDVWMGNGMKMNVIDGTMSGMPTSH
jgi:hypothetical protein